MVTVGRELEAELLGTALLPVVCIPVVVRLEATLDPVCETAFTGIDTVEDDAAGEDDTVEEVATTIVLVADD